ncbi:hypothetical protein HELRODRAFT_84140, partial [Helobdella robusta]|uniref:Cadherin domain-containing protein n=1 Tax=Helobdella robusta TaxID=6412 RepID=T1G5F3_HELRO
KSGVLRTFTRIDRDELCPTSDSCVIKIDVAVQPVEYFRILRVFVTVLDINDNPPVFPKPQVMIEILESLSSGSFIPIPMASDLDSPHNKNNNAVIKPSEKHPIKNPFKLQLVNKQISDKHTDARLVLTSSLDRERISSYRMVIVASSQRNAVLTATIEIVINLIDVNDNNPIFERMSYQTSILENTPVGSFLIRVQAHDEDSGLNGEVTYEFSSLTAGSHGNIFHLNSTTGEIRNKQVLDYEKSNSYYLTIVAQDRGPDPSPVTVTVSIFIEDENDNAPEISIVTISSQVGVGEIVENSAPATFVAQVSVTDKDNNGNNKKFDCSLRYADSDPLMSIDSDTGIIKAVVSFDRELISEINFLVIVSDGGSKPRSSTARARLVITDLNDEKPIFDRNEYSFEISENEPIKSIIGSVLAVDRDSGINAVVHYEIVSNHITHLGPDDSGIFLNFPFFEIDKNTGSISTSQVLDREAISMHRFIVMAIDGCVLSAKSSTASVRVKVLDVNDNAPTFDVFSSFVNKTYQVGGLLGH